MSTGVSPRWAVEEDAILLFFVSRGVRHDAIPELLEQRRYQRTIKAIDGRLTLLRQDNSNLILSGGGLDKAAVDCYNMKRVGVNYIRELIGFTQADSAIVIKVC